MRLGLQAPMEEDWRATLEKVRIAEDLGYELVSAGGESWGPGTLPWLAVLATNTSKVQLGTSILNVFSRSPATIAQEFSRLDQLSEGRMVLGLGSSGELVVEHFFGVPFEKPLTRIREYIEIFRMLIAGERLEYDGELFKLQRGFRLDYPRPRTEIPVWVAAITPRSLRQTAQIADGVYPLHWPTELMPQLRTLIDDAAAEVERDGSEVTIAPFTNTFILDGSAEDERRWHEARSHLHRYVCRMGVFYYQMLERNGFEAEVTAAREAWGNRDKEGSMAALTDEMVQAIQVIGPLEAVRERLQRRSDLGAQLQMLYMPDGPTAEAGKTLEALIR